MKFLLLFLALLPWPAQAASLNTKAHVLTAAVADADHLSTDPTDAVAIGKKTNMEDSTSGSVQIVWSGLTGTLNCTVTTDVSDDGTNWLAKAGTVVTLTAAAGTEVVSFNGNVSEYYYRANFAHVGCSGGLVDVYILGKG